MRAVMAVSTRATLLTACHYLFPIALLSYFVVAQLSAICCFLQGKARAPSKLQFRTAAALSVLLVLLFVGESALYILRALLRRGWWAPQDFVLYTLFSVVAWGTVAISFVESAGPVWFAFVGVWGLGGACEAVICALTTSIAPQFSVFEKARLALQVARVFVLLVLCFGGVSFALQSRDSRTDEEQQSLLGADNLPRGNQEGNEALLAGYGAIAPSEGGDGANDKPQKDEDDDSDDEGGDYDKETEKKKQERLRKDGGWLGYLKGFLVFFPIVSPMGNRRIQVYYAITALFMLWGRFENVLVPNQLGIVTNKLAEVYGTGAMPWKEIIIWILLRYVSTAAGIGAAREFLDQRISAWQQRQIETFAFNHVMSLSMDYHNDKDTGEVLRSVQQGCSVTELIDLFIMRLGPAIMDLAVAMFYITYIMDAYVAFIVFSTGVLYLWATIRLREMTIPLRRKYIKELRNEGRIVYESISNWQTVSYFNREEHEKKEYGEAVSSYLKYQTKYTDKANATSMITQLILVVGHLSVSYLAVYHVSQGTKPVGSFVALITYWANVIGPLSTLAGQYRRFNYIVTDAERLLDLFETKPTIASKPGALDLKVSGGEVVFKDVSFYYSEAKPILTDFNFTAKPGQTVALVGETGGGKSTTLKLLNRYYDVKKGSIMIDGQDIRDITLDSLRRALGSVPQEPSMFNRSVRENVRYARLDATDEEVEEACKAAAIHDKILSFPKKYKSKVGERGVKLSGGELQRLAIARVLLKRPSIVMLDEATSAVDSSTEQLIQDSFKNLSKDRTTFVIAHRLSTIVEADQILVIDGGKIIEHGTHQQLIGQNGKYRELWLKQTKEHGKTAESSATVTRIHSQEDLLVLDDDQEAEKVKEVLEQTAKEQNTDARDRADMDGCMESREVSKNTKGKSADYQEEQGEHDSTPLAVMSPKPTTGTFSHEKENKDDDKDKKRK